MTVSGPLTSINPSSPPAGRRRRDWGLRFVFISIVGWGLSAGCLPTLAQAPFPASADTTEPGSLLGPFDGKVTEAQAGRPVTGALVWVSWRFCDGKALCVPAGTETWSGETDADGRYAVPRVAHFPGAVRLDGVTVWIYKRGFITYRSDRIYDDHATGGAVPRHDFAQTRNVVRLDRFPEAGSHAQHLAFAGGSGALRAALRPEALQAGLDVAAGPTGPVTLDATALLSVEELRQITGSVDEMTVDRLQDRARTARHDSAHFRAQARGEEFDAAFRITLADDAAAADREYETQLADLPNNQPLDPAPPGLGTRIARGHEGDSETGITGLLVLDRTQRVTLLFTCGVALCHGTESLDAIARKVIARLPRIAHPPPEPVVPAPAKPETKPEEQEGLKLREPGLHR